jgi:hypothetical protein
MKERTVDHTVVSINGNVIRKGSGLEAAITSLPGAKNPFGPSGSLVAWLTMVGLWLCAAYFLARVPETGLAFGSNLTSEPTMPGRFSRG